MTPRGDRVRRRTRSDVSGPRPRRRASTVYAEGRMKTRVKRAVAVALVMLTMATPALVASTPCAQFITSAADDAPLTGWLMGESTVTTTTTTKYSSSWSFMNFGGVFDGSSTTTETYSVGVYEMSDHTIQRLRCDGYTPV